MKTIILGIVAGTIIGWVNFRLMNYGSWRTKKFYLFYLLKLTLLGIVFFLLLKSGYFHPLGLVLGLFSLPLFAWQSTKGK